MNTPASQNIPTAATATLLVNDEVLMLRRHPALHAFSGFQAFPGGKVDRVDDRPSLLAVGRGQEADATRRLNALVRELREEIGVDLAALEQAGELQEVSQIGYALTPPFAPRRFSTWFYRVRLARKPALTINPTEHTDYGWATPGQWLARYEAGELMLVPPTMLTLRDLAENSATPHLDRLAAIGKAPPGCELVEISPLNGVAVMMVRSHTLPPARFTNCFLIGDGGPDSPRLLVDPSPWDDVELDRLERQTRGRVDALFITHHHADHYERANVLAQRLAVPMWLSADTHGRIAADKPGFFDAVPSLREVHDGEVLTRWLGHAVAVLAVPGHDAGQLALLPDNRAWCLVGDLIQGIGTVVIAPPEGDMATYFATLEKVIALKPRAILPSHGLALGGTHYLQAALDHRRMRERQILDLHRTGKDVEQILAAVYAGTPAPLLPYARINIRSHLTKLAAEGALG